MSGAGFNPLHVSWNFSNPGSFGDSFGPINSIMAAIAAISAYGAYISQREELARVREQADVDRASVDRRDFEQTFFNLLKMFREIVSEIDVTAPYSADIKKGRDAFRIFVDEYVEPEAYPANIKQSYNKTYRTFQDDLGHYFRTLYHLLRFVDSGSVSDKHFYTRLIRASISEPEIEMIALNCLHGGGREKLKPFIEKYSMLHNISLTAAKKLQIISQFHRDAFGDREFLD